MSDGKPLIELDNDAGELLNRLARERGADPAAIASDAVRLFDDLYGRAGLEELNRRWGEHETSGESYTQEQVEDWLKTWGTRDYRPFRRQA